MGDSRRRKAAGRASGSGRVAYPAEITAALQAGLGQHQAGNLAQAEALYREVLARAPDNADALHFLGVLCSQQGRHDQAVELISEALRRQPRFAPALANLGNALNALGRHKEAAAACRRALELRPGFAEAHNNLGTALSALGRHEQALASYRAALALKPDYAEAHNNLGNALGALNGHEEAVASYRRALAVRADYFEAHNNLGNTLHALGRYEEAVASFRQALALRPEAVEVYNNLANALAALGREDEAREILGKALAIDPGYADAHNSLAAALWAQGRTDEALASCRQALALKPEYPEAHNNLGNMLWAQGRAGEALASCRQALALKPEYPEAHNNLGSMLQEQGNLESAMASYREALRLAPGYGDAHYELGRALLLEGNFEEGWTHYEWRIAERLADPRAPQRILPRPSTLLPLDFSGKRILLLPDQGLGDNLFFLRFASRARARGAWLAYLCSPKIASMVERSGAVDRVVETAAQAGEIDHVFSVGDLPLVLGTGDGEPLPPALALTPLPERLAAARARLRALGRGPYLAVTWRAGTPPSEQQHGQRRLLFKEAGIEPFAAALAGWRGEIVALQRRPQPGEVQRLAGLLGRPVHDLTALNEDLEAMLALLATLDDYVAVSNTNVHLMAGLGRGGRVIVPHPPEWRWMLAGEASPWFPGFRLYRQAPGQPMEQALAPLGVDLRPLT